MRTGKEPAEPAAGPWPGGGAVLHGAGSEPCWSRHPTVVQAQAQAAWGEQKWQVHTDQCPGWANWGGGRLIYPGRLLGQAWCKCVIGFVGPLVSGRTPHFADSKTMAPLGTRIHKTRDQCEYVCNNGYIMWRLLSQLMGPACQCWSVIPLTISFSLPLLSTPPCSPDSVLKPNCGPTLPSLCTFRVLPLTAPGPVSEGPALPLGLALPPSPSPSELSLEVPCPQLSVPAKSQALS